MQEKLNVPNYVVKQIIAGELYERRNAFMESARRQGKEIKDSPVMTNHVIGMMENAEDIGKLADNIRMGQIPLEQCFHELTLDEKRVVYNKCVEWQEKQKEFERTKKNKIEALREKE